MSKRQNKTKNYDQLTFYGSMELESVCLHFPILFFFFQELPRYLLKAASRAMFDKQTVHENVSIRHLAYHLYIDQSSLSTK